MNISWRLRYWKFPSFIAWIALTAAFAPEIVVKTGTLYYKEPPYQHTSEIDIYTDGSLFRRLGHIYSGYGFTIPSKNINKSFILDEPQTNNRAELMAILKGESDIVIDII